ncbi:MAG: DUF2148 domain-containing protein [Oscillospiraceae bacterium]|nr:DUF2148 domain-containing protein [Oscillospiraceae bacterium]
MIYDSKTAENAALLEAANRMCAAARTAPKARGIDLICTLILTGEDKDALAAHMESIAGEKGEGYAFFIRDAGCLRKAGAVVLIGTKGAGEDGGLLPNFDEINLGIAVGSACAAAADARVDTRVMYSVGAAAIESGLFGEEVRSALGIPLSVSGKSPFFDRK